MAANMQMYSIRRLSAMLRYRNLQPMDEPL
jgi:hypothetical protein